MALRGINIGNAAISFPMQHKKHEKETQSHKCAGCGLLHVAGKEWRFEPDLKWRCPSCRKKFRKNPLQTAVIILPVLPNGRLCEVCNSPEQVGRAKHNASGDKLRCTNCAVYYRTHNVERPAAEWREQPEGSCGNDECGSIVGSPAGGMSVGTWFAAFGEDGTRRCPRCHNYYRKQLAQQRKTGLAPRERPKGSMREQGGTTRLIRHRQH